MPSFARDTSRAKLRKPKSVCAFRKPSGKWTKGKFYPYDKVKGEKDERESCGFGMDPLRLLAGRDADQDAVYYVRCGGRSDRRGSLLNDDFYSEQDG